MEKLKQHQQSKLQQNSLAFLDDSEKPEPSSHHPSPIKQEQKGSPSVNEVIGTVRFASPNNKIKKEIDKELLKYLESQESIKQTPVKPQKPIKPSVQINEVSVN